MLFRQHPAVYLSRSSLPTKLPFHFPFILAPVQKGKLTTEPGAVSFLYHNSTVSSQPFLVIPEQHPRLDRPKVHQLRCILMIGSHLGPAQLIVSNGLPS